MGCALCGFARAMIFGANAYDGKTDLKWIIVHQVEENKNRAAREDSTVANNVDYAVVELHTSTLYRYKVYPSVFYSSRGFLIIPL
jgi:hypothetical protein